MIKKYFYYSNIKCVHTFATEAELFLNSQKMADKYNKFQKMKILKYYRV